MVGSAFLHDGDYSSIRKKLGLQHKDYTGYYEPTSSLVVISNHIKKTLNNSEYKKVMLHEIHHARQLKATTAGFVFMTLLSLRSAIFEKFVRVLNEKFSAGLWVPVKGWLDEYAREDNWYESEKYYYVSKMKASIGQLDSLLFALGAFESKNRNDCTYWALRFPWANILPDDSWEGAFSRSLSYDGWWPHGLISLLEASTFYLELLNKLKDITSANNELKSIINSERVALGEKEFKNSYNMIYFGPFLLCEKVAPNSPPFHLVPIAAFWAMNGPIPHIRVSSSISGRENTRKCSWTQFEPGNLYYNILLEIIDDLQKESLDQNVLDLAKKWKPVFWSTIDKNPIYPEQIVDEDLDYLSKICANGKEIGYSFGGNFKITNFPDTLDKRIESFFIFPCDEADFPEVAVISPEEDATPDQKTLEMYLLSQLAEHLIPIWSFRSLDRFRLGNIFSCPSNNIPFDSLCPVKESCNGLFPGIKGVPSKCWFVDGIRNTLCLDPYRIGIVSGEYGSEEEVRSHNW